VRHFLGLLLALLFCGTAALGQGANPYEQSRLSPHLGAGPELLLGVQGDGLLAIDGKRLWRLADTSSEWQVLPELEQDWTGATVLSYSGGLVLAGGLEQGQHHGRVLLLSAQGRRELLPELPAGLAQGAGVIIGQQLLLFGGLREPEVSAREASADVWSMNLGAAPVQRAWRQLPSWPGPPRFLLEAAVFGSEVFLVGGATLEADGAGGVQRSYLQDVYAFDPALESWRVAASVPADEEAAPGMLVRLGREHLALLQTQLQVYHPQTDRWSERGILAIAPRNVSSTVWPTAGGTVWVNPSGYLELLRPLAPERRFGRANSATLVGYLLLLGFLGLAFRRRTNTSEGYLLGGGKVPGWAAGLSIFATQVSAITFLTIPAKAFATDWTYLLGALGVVFIAPFVAAVFLPYFRRVGGASAYALLEERFSPGLRAFGALSFGLYQLGRTSIVVYLPAMALAAVTGLDVLPCILARGGVATLYTRLGGLEAVIWTDVLQVLVLLVGALLVALYALLGAGPMETVEAAWGAGKLRLANPGWNLDGPSLLVLCGYAIFGNLALFVTDQAVVQRFLATRDEYDARAALWTGALVAVPASLVFYALGTALWGFYGAHPEALDLFAGGDRLVPSFVVSQMPVGLAGLVIAAVFAAAMSSIDSSIHSLSTVLAVDGYGRWRPSASDAMRVALAKRATWVFGLLVTSGALLLASFDLVSLLDTFLQVLGLFGGPLLGLFLLAVGVRRARSVHAWCGVLAGVSILGWALLDGRLSGLAYGMVGALMTLGVGALASVFFPRVGSRAGGQ
jgi:SSS family solute:Na+ symporter